MSRLGARVSKLEGASTCDVIAVVSDRLLADDGELDALLAGVKPDHRGRVWLIGPKMTEREWLDWCAREGERWAD